MRQDRRLSDGYGRNGPGRGTEAPEGASDLDLNPKKWTTYMTIWP